MKRLLLLSTTLLLAGSLDDEVKQLKSQMSDVGVQNMFGTYGAQSATGRVESPNNTSIHFDLLYWRAFNPNIVFTRSYESRTPRGQVGSNLTAETNVMTWDLGFRTGFTYNLPHDGWELSVDYTRFVPQHSDQVSGKIVSVDNFAVNDQWPVSEGDPPGGPYGSGATNSHRIKFQMIEAAISTPFFIKKTLSFSPAVGVAGYLIQTRNNTVYLGSAYSNSVGLSTHSLSETRLKGVTATAAGSVSWFITPRWKLHSSLLFGFPAFLARVNTVEDAPNSPERAQTDRIRRRFLDAIFDAKAGLEYFREFPQSGRSLSLRLLYESLLVGAGEAFFQGWTLATRVHF